MVMASDEDCFKMNTLDLAKEHREKCKGESCTISLQVLRIMAERAGVVFTDEEMKVLECGDEGKK